MDCATMVLHTCHVQETQMQFGASLDLAKAFDSVHTTLAVEVLRLHGLPDIVCQCLQHAWSHQTRYPVVQGCVAREPVRCQVLPQGDPWSPWALSLLIGLLAHETNIQSGVQCEPFLFLDDRTLFTRTLSALSRIITAWDQVGSTFGLSNNPDKLQVWTVADSSYECLNLFPNNFTAQPQVLGHILPATSNPGQIVQPESSRNPLIVKQWKEVTDITARMRHLQVSEAFRWKLWRTLVCPKLAWVYSLGISPSVDETNRYKALLKQTLQGSMSSTRHAFDLRLAIQTGYQGDLHALTALTQLRVVFRWVRQKQAMLRNSISNRVFARIALIFNAHEISWTVRPSGLSWNWRMEAQQFNVFDTKQADKFWHFTRSHWRLQRLINWLQESRRDSQIAQSTDIVPCLELIRTLRKIHFKVSQNARAVMLGGFTTEATMKAERARELSCRYCGLAPPFLEHILWDCPHFVRWPSRPPDPLAARLGWTWPLDISVANACQRLTMMGDIRDRDAKSRTSVGGPHHRVHRG